MDLNEIKSFIKDVIEESTGSSVEYDTMLFDEEILDSMSILYLIGELDNVSVVKRELRFTLYADYPDNTKLAKIAFSPSVFEHIDVSLADNISPIVPAMLTIKFTDSSPIVATLDTDNSDTEHFIYNVPTNLQNKTISKYTNFKVYFLQ